MSDDPRESTGQELVNHHQRGAKTSGAEEPSEEEPAVDSDVDAMEKLRELLFGGERSTLSRIQERLADPNRQVEEVSRVLPEAIRRRADSDSQLTGALTPSIEEGLKSSVRKDPVAIADALFPVIGPAIRKSIADTFSKLAQSFNQALEHSLTVRSLKWRIQAKRTGRSFAEVVLLHTLVYRVEQVFLIFRKSGLVLQNVAAESVAVQDGDMVSGMLTAIQDFARDSFVVQDGDSLDSLQVGELIVWIERGPKAVLAAVIRGTPPQDLRTQLQSLVERIHVEYEEPLRSFSGDTRPFDASYEDLEKCLLTVQRGEAKNQRGEGKKKKSNVIAWAGLVAIVLLIAFWGALAFRDHLRWKDYLTRLAEEPGIVLVNSGKRRGNYFVSGLRDPLATHPSDFLTAANLESEQVEQSWQTYYSAESDIVLARVRTLLQPPGSVELNVNEGVLAVSGRADYEWIERLNRVASLIPGVLILQDDDLVTNDRSASILEHAEEVLQPPASVQLSLVDGVLHASGRASPRWIEAAHILTRTIRDVVGFDDGELVDATDRSELLLTAAREFLDPPATVDLHVEGDTLIASGSAAHEWIEAARLLARAIPGLGQLRTDELVASDLDSVILKRAQLALKPPPVVRLHVENRILTLSGVAPRSWIADARRYASLIPGIVRVREDELSDAESMKLKEARRFIEHQILHFGQNSGQMAPADQERLTALVKSIQELLEAARNIDKEVRVMVIGHSDDTGQAKANLRLSTKRAQSVLNVLSERGVPRAALTPKGAGATTLSARSPAIKEKSSNRRVTFEVVIAGATEP